MKILRIYTRVPPMRGGMEKHIYHLTLEQNKLGHDVTVYFNRGEKITDKDVQITKIPLDATKPRFVGIILFYFLIVIKVLFKKVNYDVVHIHGDWSSLIFSKLIKKLTNANVLVFSIHDDIKENFIYKYIFSVLLKQVDIIFSTGFSAAKKIKLISDKNVIVQPSGINKIFFEPNIKNHNNATMQVITVANLVPKKNLNLVLDIAKELQSINFIIVGDGNEKSRIQKRITNENIDNLKLLGFKTLDEVKTLYCESNLFLLTSYAEGTPTAILEAMKCGLPIVCSNIGGIKELIKENINGNVIDGYIKEDYIKKMLKFDSNLIKKVSENNSLLADRFSWGKVSLKITKIIYSHK